jgi:hypothetical protein
MGLPLDVTIPAPASITSCPNCRSPERLREVCAQFEVEREPRYQPRDTSGDGRQDTHCDAFVGDCTRALGCEIPQWDKGRELSANGMIDWLAGSRGQLYGWRRCDGRDAMRYAAAGCPVVACWRNPAGSGHVAMVLPPGLDGTLRIAQAGRRCLWDVTLADGFGRWAKDAIFFAHE